MLSELSKHYSQNQLPFSTFQEEIHEYLKILQIESYYSNSRLIFIITFSPLLSLTPQPLYPLNHIRR